MGRALILVKAASALKIIARRPLSGKFCEKEQDMFQIELQQLYFGAFAAHIRLLVAQRLLQP